MGLATEHYKINKMVDLDCQLHWLWNKLRAMPQGRSLRAFSEGLIYRRSLFPGAGGTFGRWPTNEEVRGKKIAACMPLLVEAKGSNLCCSCWWHSLLTSKSIFFGFQCELKISSYPGIFHAISMRLGLLMHPGSWTEELLGSRLLLLNPYW